MTIFKLPVLRGAVGLVEMLVVGIRTLNFSAEVAMTEDQAARRRRPVARAEQISGSGFSLALALAVGVAVFFVTPLVLGDRSCSTSTRTRCCSTSPGVDPPGLFLLYLCGDRRLDEGHPEGSSRITGRNTRSCSPSSGVLELTVEAALGQSRFHPRCGTSFLLVVMMSAILVFAIVDGILISLTGPSRCRCAC